MADEAPAWVTRKLLRAARSGTLATSIEGQPFASLVTLACAPDLSLLLLLSDLSEHTRHLRAEPRCAVLVAGAPESANPQTAPRATVTGLAEMVDDPALKRRWLTVHPYGGLYAGFADFHVWRIRPKSALFVGGFARANRLRLADLTPDPDAVAAVAEAEDRILIHMNHDHPEAVAHLGAMASGRTGAWSMAAADTDGCDLELDEQTVRLPWRAPVADSSGVRQELMWMLRDEEA